MGYKTRAVVTERKPPAVHCAGCAKAINPDYDDTAVEIRLGILSPRARTTAFIPNKEWGVMHPQCFSLAMGLGDRL